MTRKLPLFATLVSAIILLAFVVVLADKVEYQKTTIYTQSKKLHEAAGTIKVMTAENEELQWQLQQLTDSIQLLNGELLHLEERLAEQESAIRMLTGKINQRESKIASMKKEIAHLSRKSGNYANKIKELENEKKEMRLELELMNVQKEDAEVVTNDLKLKRKETALKNQKVNHTANIARNTRVRFDRILLRSRDNRGDLKRLKYDDTRWKYTKLDFFLEHPHRQLLLDEKFLVQIVDLDTGKILPFNESNPAYPESPQGSNGFKVTFDGNMVETTYFNSQKKQSMNYEVRIYYYRDGIAYPLQDGRKRIVQNGKVLPLENGKPLSQ